MCSFSGLSFFDQMNLFIVTVDFYSKSFFRFFPRPDVPLFNVMLGSVGFLVKRPFSNFDDIFSMVTDYMIYYDIKVVGSHTAITAEIGILLTVSVDIKYRKSRYTEWSGLLNLFLLFVFILFYYYVSPMLAEVPQSLTYAVGDLEG